MKERINLKRDFVILSSFRKEINLNTKVKNSKKIYNRKKLKGNYE